MESTFGEHMSECLIFDDDGNDQFIIGIHFLLHPNIHAILNFKDKDIEIQNIKMPLKVITTIKPLAKSFLSVAYNNVLEEIPEEDRQWVSSTIFPLTSTLIPNLIVQQLHQDQVIMEYPIETAIVNITNGKCPLLFVNNRPNSIKLCPNQLVAITKHMLESMAVQILDNGIHVSVAASDCNLTNHELAALDKFLPHHTDKQKLEFALNKITEKMHNAFEGIKKALTTSLFLGYSVYDGKAQFVIQTDASTTAISAILYQESGDQTWADDSWLSSMMVMGPLTMAIASPFSAAEFNVNNILMQHAQMLNEVARTMFYNCIRFPPDGNLRTCLIEWMNHFPECEPTSNHDPGIYICNHFTL
uniref:Reverse transcriptase/retrotransposon-derived protein RNase H-like domain-containing protein n=1 Tax=Romanomermis culicivorax TaxID=13658 RepID=A0A915KVH9_ROMCU